MINFSEQNKRKQLKSEGLKYDNKDSFSALKETCQKYYGIKSCFLLINQCGQTSPGK